MDTVDFMRKEVEFTPHIKDETHGLTIVLLYEEADNSECLRTLYGYQVGDGQIEKPMSSDPDISIDWGQEIYGEITDWFFATFASQEAEINEQVSKDIDEVFSEIWDTLEAENLV